MYSHIYSCETDFIPLKIIVDLILNMAYLYSLLQPVALGAINKLP